VSTLPEVGQIWRKAGPCDWFCIRRVQMPGAPGYDGGVSGCSVFRSTGAGGWYTASEFIPSDDWSDSMENLRVLYDEATAEPWARAMVARIRSRMARLRKEASQ
jgi:hypothetical protein